MTSCVWAQVDKLSVTRLAKQNEQEERSGALLHLFALLKWGTLEDGAVPFSRPPCLITEVITSTTCICYNRTTTRKKHLQRPKSCHQFKNWLHAAAILSANRQLTRAETRLHLQSEHTPFLKANSPNKELIHNTQQLQQAKEQHNFSFVKISSYYRNLPRNLPNFPLLIIHPVKKFQ